VSRASYWPALRSHLEQERYQIWIWLESNVFYYGGVDWGIVLTILSYNTGLLILRLTGIYISLTMKVLS
jgi:hypothetical protein